MRKKDRGFTLVEVLTVVAIMALLFSFLVPSLFQSKKAANEAGAKTTLRNIAAALETYSLTNGVYPNTTTSLLGDSPPYLNKDYFSGVLEGYVYSATLNPGYYTVMALPITSGIPMSTFTITTGSVLSEQAP